MSLSLLDAERRHLAELIEAVQRCVFFLDDSSTRVSWPLDSAELAARKKDGDLFQALAAINERFAKLQDTLAAAMRHAALLLGTLHQLQPILYGAAGRFVALCRADLAVGPADADFADDFVRITRAAPSAPRP